MKFLYALFFLSLGLKGNAQWSDNFDDGDFQHSPAWTGDSMDFIVNGNQQLQLNAGTAGISSLSLVSDPDMNIPLEWRFFIHLNFSPSSGNYGRVYLVSDQADLSGPLNGYYLQFGESLSNDAVELFRQDGTSSVSVCRARDAGIATAFSVSVRVTRDEIGLWTLWIDYNGGTDYVQECYGAEALYTSSAYFGILCEYTSGNRTNFYFDDFYVGPLLQDTLPPEISGYECTSANTLHIQLSEGMDVSGAENPINYSLDGGLFHPLSAQLDVADPASVSLVFSGDFIPGYTYTLLIGGLSDFAGNFIDPGTSISFTYYPVAIASPGDVIFTEIMFEPSSTSALPNTEYVEIYNRRREAVSLKNWTISDGSSTAAFPDVKIFPATYVILCNASFAQSFSAYGNTLGLTSFPVLNNDVGDHLVLNDEQGQLIDEITFSNQTYHDATKDDGGYSLERIDTGFFCQDELNWKASASPQGGTPGHTNSVSGIYTDHEKPVLLRAVLSDSLHLHLFFSEAMDESTLLNPFIFTISREGEEDFNPVMVTEGENTGECILLLPFPVLHEIYSLSTGFGLKDCPGNDLDNSRQVKFAKASTVDSSDIVINEILFNPSSGGVDFVELYNRSAKVLDLRRWRIAEAPYGNLIAAQSSKSISEESFLLFPGDYLVLTSNSSDIRMRYSNPGPWAFIDVKDFPDFNSTEGGIVLYDSLGNILDEFSYSENMHFPLLIETKGVSLERLSPEISADLENNWHSASSSDGYATPGFKNSISLSNESKEDELILEPSVFTPDNDGLNDMLFIRLKQSSDSPGIAKLCVYNLQGQLIRKLARQMLIGDETLVLWDGLDENGQLAAIGTYVLYAEVFNADGRVNKKKKAFALNLK